MYDIQQLNPRKAFSQFGIYISKEVKELLTAYDDFYIFLVGNIIFL